MLAEKERTPRDKDHKAVSTSQDVLQEAPLAAWQFAVAGDDQDLLSRGSQEIPGEKSVEEATRIGQKRSLSRPKERSFAACREAAST